MSAAFWLEHRLYQVEIYYPDGTYQELVPREELPTPVATAPAEVLPTAPPTNTPHPSTYPVYCEMEQLFPIQSPIDCSSIVTGISMKSVPSGSSSR